MKKLIGISIAVLCTMMAHPAERPAACQAPIENLSGKLPVADYLDAVMNCSGLEAPGGAQTGTAVVMPASAWLDADAERYSQLLAKQKYTWLVLPAQTQYMGFDFAERALISAEIASVFADQGNSPDIVLVARALGEPRRRYAQLPVEVLTAALGVQHRVATYVGHDGNFKMTLTVQLQECAPNGRCKVIKQRDWRNLGFTDELPPFRVVNKLRAEIRRDVLAKDPMAAPTIAAGNARYLGVTPAKLFASAPTATTASLLASLASDGDELSRDRLHAIALRGWLDAPPSVESRFYAAYSALALQRRPYALELINQQKDPASDVLRELLNGNLPEAREKFPRVKVPLQRLLLSFLLQDLAADYHREIAFDANLAQQVFGDAHAQWQALLVRRADNADIWRHGDADYIKLLLDALAPIQGLRLAEVRMGSMVAGREKLLELTNFRHLRQAVDILDANATRWQAYWLLEGLAQADVFSTLHRTINLQAAPVSGRALVREFEGVLDGHPAFELKRASLLAALGKDGDNDEKRRYDQATAQSLWSAVYWAQGANRVSYFTAFRGLKTAAFADAYGLDFPLRYYWPHPVGVARESSRGCRLLKYSVTSAEDFSICLSGLKGTDADKLIADVRARFHGSPGASSIVETAPAKPATPEDPAEALIARTRAQIKADPENWNNYQNLGTSLITNRGAYSEAQRIYLSYPLFKTLPARRAVELSQQAYAAGSELFWKGQPELARPLYQIAADLDTGSEGSMTSAARLAQLDGDYESAAQLSLERGMRYRSSYAYRDYLSLLHVMGHADEANAAFMQVAEAFEGPQVWMATLTGQRMNGMTFDQFRAWVSSREIADAHYRGRKFAGYYTLMWTTADRRPDANSAKLLEQLLRGEVRRVSASNGMVMRANPVDEGKEEMMNPSAFLQEKRGMPTPGPVPHEHLLFSQGLSALYAGQYQAAHEIFVKYAYYYAIEWRETQFALAYFALAAAKTGDKRSLEKFIAGDSVAYNGFDGWLARAFFASVRKDVDTAENALKHAFYVRPHTDLRPVMTEYQYAEACEIVGRETGDPRFLRMMLEWAKQNQRIQPTQAWSYAVEAQYSKNPVDANRALALALYLDPASPRLVGIDDKRRAAARAWLRSNNPFLTNAPVKAKPVT